MPTHAPGVWLYCTKGGALLEATWSMVESSQQLDRCAYVSVSSSTMLARAHVWAVASMGGRFCVKFSFYWCSSRMFAVYPLRCSPALLGFALRDSAAAPRRQGAARTRGGTLAGGATRIRGASGSERPRAAMSSPASLPKEIHRSAELGELQKVVKWLRKGGLVDAHCSTTTRDGRPTTITLLHAAAAHGHLAMVRELLKRGASVDLQSSLGSTALMAAAGYGHLSIVLVLLQHSANPDLQDIDGRHRPDGGR